MASARQLTIKNRKQEKENIAAVTWISLPPERSSRTSLKSVADYLSEVQDDVPMPKRRYCLSPETLNALEDAEKLVEDAEKQISQMNLETLLADDLEDEYDCRGNKDENIYIRNVVASTFKKGFYDPGTSLLLSKEKLKSRSTLADLKRLQVKSDVYKSPRVLKESKNLHNNRAGFLLEQDNRKSLLDDCPVCKENKCEPIATGLHQNKLADATKLDANVAERKIDEDKPEKLNIQKGPVISIKGDFSVQTRQIIDIPPEESAPRIFSENVDNIATYEFHHKSYTKEKSPDIKLVQHSRTYEKPEKDVVLQSLFLEDKSSGTSLKLDGTRTRRSERKRLNKSTLDRRSDSVPFRKELIDDECATKAKEQRFEREFDFWKDFNDVDVDLQNISLGEPRILMEVDTFLDQQRRIIRQVHDATEKFDKFLSRRLPDEVSISNSSKSNREEGTKKAEKLPRKQKSNPLDEGKNKKLIDNQKLVEPTKELYRIESSDARYNPDTTLSTIHSVASGSEIKEPIDSVNLSNNTETSKQNSIDSKSRKIMEIPEKDSSSKGNESSDVISKDLEYSDSFENASSASETAKQSVDSASSKISNSKIEQNRADREFSSTVSSFLQTSIHTETKSNGGLIEDFRSTQIVKENNLAANPCQDDKKIRESQKSVENVNEMDKKTLPDGNSEKSSIRKSNKDGEYVNNVNSNATNGQELENKSYSTIASAENQSKEMEIEENDGLKDIGVENIKDATTEKVQDKVETSSQKTSHLIESISDVSFHKANVSIQNSEDSLRLFSVSNDDVSNVRESVAEQSSIEKSTESKIESKLSEARDNLNTLMRTINDNDRNSNHTNNVDSSSNQSCTKIQENSDKLPVSVSEVPMKLNDNNLIRKNFVNYDRRNTNFVHFNNETQTTQENNLSNRSFVTLLEENSNAVLESFQQQKFSLLKKLESCSLTSRNQKKRLFTSTVLGDTEPPNSFARLKGASESSSETHSEGEVCFSSSASYSLGEIRKKTEANSCTKASSSSSTNPNMSLPYSMGEVCGVNGNSTSTSGVNCFI